MEELGSGFYLAMHDLEIRGAGEVLGESQSGDMQEVGFALYTEMLDEAVRSLKAGREPDLSAPLAATTEIKLHVPALLPGDYCRDVHERLTLYKRLANCATREALDTLREELVDRFGKLPDAARALVDTHRLRIASRPLGIARIDAAADAIVVQFVPDPPIDAASDHPLHPEPARRQALGSGPAAVHAADPRPGDAPAAHPRDPAGPRRQGGGTMSRLVVQHPRALRPRGGRIPRRARPRSDPAPAAARDLGAGGDRRRSGRRDCRQLSASTQRSCRCRRAWRTTG